MAPLADNSKDLSITDGGELSGQVKMNNGNWTNQKIDVNAKLANANGTFKIRGNENGFVHSAERGETKMEGTILKAKLDKGRRDYIDASIDLADIIEVVDGKFAYKSQSSSRREETTQVPVSILADKTKDLEISNAGLLSGGTKKNNGTWTTHTIDLASRFGNRNGRLDLDGSNFAATAQAMQLEGTKLLLELKTARRGIKPDSLELSNILEVTDDGEFVFKEAFERGCEERRAFHESLGGLAGKTRNLHIRGNGYLSGQTKKGDGTWTTNEINLGHHLVNHDGRFRFFRRLDRVGFPQSASDLSLEGTRLDAQLNKGTSSTKYAASVELELVLRVDSDGKFVVITADERKRIISSASCMGLGNVEGEPQVHALHGLCLDEYCKLEYSSITLNEHYESVAQAKQINLEVTPTQVLLCDGDEVMDDLNINIENQMGRFVYVNHDSFFGRDGAGTLASEEIPGLGYIAALVHLSKGNNQWAKRAVAVTTNATILAIGFTIGGLVGGHMGAAIGGGIATSFGILAETEIKKSIQDAALLARFEEATIGRYVYETLQNTLTFAAGAAFAQWVKNIRTEKFSKLLQKFHKVVQKQGKKVVKKVTSETIEKIRDALVGNELPQEWINAENEVRALR